jgi:hypothetical protein
VKTRSVEHKKNGKSKSQFYEADDGSRSKVKISELYEPPTRKVEKKLPSRREFYLQMNIQRADDLIKRFAKGAPKDGRSKRSILDTSSRRDISDTGS